MRVIGFDGKEYPWNITKGNARQTCSAGHAEARRLLQEMFKFDQILEELTLPGSRTSDHNVLRCDFYIPKRHLMVEIQGEQHDKYIPHFHGTKMDFLKAKKRDRNKKEWCDMNSIVLVTLPYSRNIDLNDWEKRISSAIST
jgi:hypothetical protein